jgi:hypothetical protein
MDDHDPQTLHDQIPGELCVRRANFVTQVLGAAGRASLEQRIRVLSRRLILREADGISLCDPGEIFQLASE